MEQKDLGGCYGRHRVETPASVLDPLACGIMKSTFWSRFLSRLPRRRLANGLVMMFLHGGVLILTIFSIVEAIKTISASIHNLEKGKDIILIGALTAALVPSGAMLFWACTAIKLQLEFSIRRMCQRFRNHKT
jgi:hypothetical protein